MSVKKSVLEKKTTQELYQYLNAKNSFLSEAVQYAFEILQSRGENFDEHETERIKALIEEREQKENEQPAKQTYWDKNAVEDDSAMPLYSQRVIWIFSVLFGVITGSILLAINLAKLNQKKTAFGVVAFGVVYTTFQVILSEYLDKINFILTGRTFLLSALGAIVLHYSWEKFIPTDFKYRKRAVWLPALICVGLASLIIFAMIKGY
ncbi:hypothetical protein [Pedobacter montanisoli]|uniref:DUF1129 domain-containing protein n=1 Tax=Pedobacter montanisoli TaxID=2923277 RepID=A0ABS9ZWL4_9SPHI|nr:hypothetical protein [Pedobacter montanisoli]MCJ0742695.1 hypothetical protein [Pedobacter montanisoli]